MKTCLIFWLCFTLILDASNSFATTFYVDAAGTNATTPFMSWQKAATNIQDAVDVAVDGDIVLVTNGVYKYGGYKAGSIYLWRVYINSAIELRSVNGPGVTTIQGLLGSQAGGPTQCVVLYNSNAILSGFTITNGKSSGTHAAGGVYCHFINIGDPSGLLTNCIITGNYGQNGGGVWGGRLKDCLLTGNYAVQGGGGAMFSTLEDCIVSNNTAFSSAGAGIRGCTAINCLIVNNKANGGGGGADGCTLINCIVTGNSVATNTGTVGGVSSCAVFNSIIYGNIASNNANFYLSDLHHCCTFPDPGSGVGNITNDPAFVNPTAGDYHLQSKSPCINAGNNSYVQDINDFDGNPRICGGTVDIGCYEFQSPASRLSYSWAQRFNLPTDGSAVFCG